MDECKNCANMDNEYCFACDNGNQFKPMTNGDRIRSMSDEELAEWIAKKLTCPSYEYPCSELATHKKCCQCWINWLKQEVDT